MLVYNAGFLGVSYLSFFLAWFKVRALLSVPAKLKVKNLFLTNFQKLVQTFHSFQNHSYCSEFHPLLFLRKLSNPTHHSCCSIAVSCQALRHRGRCCILDWLCSNNNRKVLHSLVTFPLHQTDVATQLVCGIYFSVSCIFYAREKRSLLLCLLLLSDAPWQADRVSCAAAYPIQQEHI